MADVTPSLSELQNYRPNAELAAGDRIAVPDDRMAVQAILQGARDTANNTWNRYLINQKNLDANIEKYKSDYDKARPQDVAELSKRQAEVLSIIAKDPSMLANPNKNPQLWGQLNEKYGSLQADIAKSKTAYAYTMEQRKIQSQDPNLRTKENDAVIQSAEATPLDKFEVFQLKPPTVLDFATLTKGGLERSTVSNPVDDAIFEATVDKDGKPIPVMENGQHKLGEDGKPVYKQHYTGKRRVGIEKYYDEPAYKKYGEAIYESNQPINKYGTTVQESVSNLFNLLPQAQKEDVIAAAKKAGEKDVMKHFFKTSYNKYFDPTKDISGVKSEDDKKYLEDLRFGREQANILLKGSLDKDAIKLRWGLENADKEKQTDALLRVTGSALGNTEDRKIAVKNAKGDGFTTYQYLKPNDETLNIFGEAQKTSTKEENIDGANVSVTTSTSVANKPDALARSENGGVVSLYFIKDDKGNVKYDNGDKTKPQLARQDVFSPAEVLGLVAKNFKIKPESISSAEKILEDQFGGNIINYADGRKVGRNIAEDKKNSGGSTKSSGSVEIKTAPSAEKLEKLRNKYSY